MRARVQVVSLLLALLFCLAVPRAESQNLGFRFVPPVNNLAVTGSHRVAWESPGIIIDPGLTSLTWYYSAQPGGQDRKRMVTGLKYEFKNGFRNQWQPNGGFIFDWQVEKDPDREFSYLKTPRDGAAGEIISNDAVQGDFVMSALVRTTTLSPLFGMRFRIQRNGDSLQLLSRPRENRLMFMGDGLQQPPAWRMPMMRRAQWYWVEVGVRNVKRAVEARVRIFDEKHQALVFSDTYIGRPNAGLLNGGLISLLPTAEYGDIYLDRWDTRWLDGSGKEFRWDTSQVPNGKYFLIAEFHNGKGAPQTVVSDFQVEVRNPGQAALIQ